MDQNLGTIWRWRSCAIAQIAPRQSNIGVLSFPSNLLMRQRSLTSDHLRESVVKIINYVVVVIFFCLVPKQCTIGELRHNLQVTLTIYKWAWREGKTHSKFTQFISCSLYYYSFKQKSYFWWKCDLCKCDVRIFSFSNPSQWLKGFYLHEYISQRP